MINYIGLGDLYRIYLTMQRAGAGFNVAYIGDDFQAEHKEQFDPGYMRALYRFGYERQRGVTRGSMRHRGLKTRTGDEVKSI
ncbi:MAG: hypothetical protein ACLPKT_12245 [Methylocella sp.]